MTKNLKPFDLQTALQGKAVMLRNGQKAFIRHQETEMPILGNFTLIGVAEGRQRYLAWKPEGAYGEYESVYDIIGMYPKTRIINGFEVPAPEVEELELGCSYFAPYIHSDKYLARLTWNGDDCDMRSLKRGLVFLSKEDAIANAKAMLGISPLLNEGE